MDDDYYCLKHFMDKGQKGKVWLHVLESISTTSLSEYKIVCCCQEKLLFDLTRNTGFEVSKGNIGECWIKSCCEWSNRQDNDICGLDGSYLSVTEKMKNIFSGTSLHSEFSNLGLEVMV